MLAAANAGAGVFCIEGSAGSVVRSHPIRPASSMAALAIVGGRIIRFSR